MLARLAARLLLAPLGLVCGLIAGSAMLVTSSVDDFGVSATMPYEIAVLGHDMSLDIATIAFLLAPLFIAPAIVAVLIAEMFSIRSWIYFAIAGALAAYLPWSAARTAFDGQIFTMAQIMACGLAGGLVHWLVAGRSSGLAEPRVETP